MRGNCETGSWKMAMPPAMERTIAITIAKRGRSTKMRENGLSASIAGLRESFIFGSLLDRRLVVGVDVVV